MFMNLIRSSKLPIFRSKVTGLVQRTVKSINTFRNKRAFGKAANRLSKGVELSVLDSPDFFEFLFEHYKPQNEASKRTLAELKKQYESEDGFAELKFESPKELEILSRYYNYKAKQIASSPKTGATLGPISADAYIERAALVNETRGYLLRFASMKKAGTLGRLLKGRKS